MALGDPDQQLPRAAADVEDAVPGPEPERVERLADALRMQRVVEGAIAVGDRGDAVAVHEAADGTATAALGSREAMHADGADRVGHGEASLGEAQSSNPPDDPDMIEPDAARSTRTPTTRATRTPPEEPPTTTTPPRTSRDYQPHAPTLSEVVRRAVEIVDPEGISGDVERYLLHFEDRDEPISAIEDIQAEAFDAASKMGAEDPVDPSVTMAAAVTTYLGFRRDEVEDDDLDILVLAARAEFHGRPPADIASWLEERGVEAKWASS